MSDVIQANGKHINEEFRLKTTFMLNSQLTLTKENPTHTHIQRNISFTFLFVVLIKLYSIRDRA